MADHVFKKTVILGSKGKRKPYFIDNGVWKSFVASRNAAKGFGLSAGFADGYAQGIIVSDLLGGESQFEYKYPEIHEFFVECREKLNAIKATNEVPEGDERFSKVDEFGGSECSYKAELQFMFQNLEIEGVRKCDAPSPHAWSMLKRARKDTTFLDDRYKDYRSLSDKKETSDNDMMKGGEDQCKMLDKIIAAKNARDALEEVIISEDDNE